MTLDPTTAASPDANGEPTTQPTAVAAGRRRGVKVALVSAGLIAGVIGATAFGASAQSSSSGTTASGSSASANGSANGSTANGSTANGLMPNGSMPNGSAPSGQPNPGGARPVRSDEKAVDSATAAKLKAAALKAVPGGTVIRVETDAGDGVYEAHVKKSDGTLVTVKFDKNLNVTKVESGMGQGDPAPAGQPNGRPAQGTGN